MKANRMSLKAIVGFCFALLTSMACWSQSNNKGVGSNDYFYFTVPTISYYYHHPYDNGSFQLDVFRPGIGLGYSRQVLSKDKYGLSVSGELCYQSGFNIRKYTSAMPINKQGEVLEVQKLVLFKIPIAFGKRFNNGSKLSLRASSNILIKPISYFGTNEYPYSEDKLYNWLFASGGLEYSFNKFPVQLYLEQNISPYLRGGQSFLTIFGIGAYLP